MGQCLAQSKPQKLVSSFPRPRLHSHLRPHSKCSTDLAPPRPNLPDGRRRSRLAKFPFVARVVNPILTNYCRLCPFVVVSPAILPTMSWARCSARLVVVLPQQLLSLTPARVALVLHSPSRHARLLSEV